MTDELLQVRHLTHRFPLGRGQMVTALHDVSFTLHRGEILALVGESGSGKSTAARCVMSLLRPDEGEIWYNGVNICDRKAAHQQRKMLQTTRQIIFQDSASSLDPCMRVEDIITEPLRIHRITPPRGTYRAEAAFQMHYAGLEPSCIDKYPAQLSGGQRQRVAIARALVMEPELLVADEPIAALDVSMQAQIVNLFRHLQREHGFSFLFIAHDLTMVEFLCDRVAVLYRGHLVELGKVGDVFAHPLHPYTQALLSAVPVPDPTVERKRDIITAASAYPTSGTWQEAEAGHFVLREERP